MRLGTSGAFNNCLPPAAAPRFRTLVRRGKRECDARRGSHGVAHRPRSCAPRAAPRGVSSRGERRAEAFGTFGPKSTKKKEVVSTSSFRNSLRFSEKRQKDFFFFPAFRWRKAAKATRPIPMPASGRLKAASGDCSRVCKQTVPAAHAFSRPSASPPSEPNRGLALRRKENWSCRETKGA